MILEELNEEVRQRGYHYVATGRIDQWINRAYLEICGRQPWPFLETVTTGPAPVNLPGLLSILYVTSNGVEVEGGDVRDLLDRDPDLAEVGDPRYWYLTGENLNVWPDYTGDLTVRHASLPVKLTAGTSPLFPEQYHEMLIDGAVVRGLKDNDEYDQAAGLQQIIDARVQNMIDTLIARNAQGPASMVRTASESV